jgi:hypothetical protein
MLSLDMLYAVLQGLPPKYLNHLEWPWPQFCERIARSLNSGADAAAALRSAVNSCSPSQLAAIKKSLREIEPVMHLPGLTYRQREALIALRNSKTASLAHLTHILALDRSNIHRSLSALIKKGYAIRFFRPGGVHYMAIDSPIEKSVKLAAFQMITEILKKT